MFNKITNAIKAVIEDFSNAWIWIAMLTSGYLFLRIEKNLYDLLNINFLGLRSFVLILFLVLAFIFVFLLNPKKNLQKEKLWNQHSWVFYGYFSVIFAPLVSFSLNYLVFKEMCKNYDIYCYNNLFSDVQFIIALSTRILIAFIGFCIYYYIKGKLPDQSLRFAANSAGLRNDGLGYAKSAKNWAKGLSRLNDYVNIVYLFGDMGFGKSSFARMIVESLERKNTLYTYISLTETNEAKDFSLLFSERWLESLKERYPKINVFDGSLFLSSILRESGNGLFSEIVTFLTKFNRGLMNTKAKVYDKYIDKQRPYTSDYIAQLFGNVPDFKENLWLIMIDEIERAKLEEIYRVMEVLERFKAEGRTGLPLKLIFLICISQQDLDDLLKNPSDEDKDIAIQIKKFMVDDPKSIITRIFLPPVSYETRKKYLSDTLNTFIEENHVKGLTDINKYQPDTFFNPENKHVISDQDAIQFGLGLLIYESPRLIQRCIQELDLFYRSFRNVEGRKVLYYIRFPDILIATYASIRYPYIITFFQKTLNQFLLNSEDSFFVSSYLDRDKYKKGEKNIFDWIKEATGIEVPNAEKLNVIKIIGMIANFYLIYVKNNESNQNNLWRETSLSKPENLRDYLSIIASEPNDMSRKSFQVYLEHTKSLNKNFLKKLKAEELIEYSRFLWVIEDANILSKFELAEEFCRRFINSAFPVKKYGITETIYEHAIYQFIFNLLVIYEAADAYARTKEAVAAYPKAIKLIKQFLTSPNVLTGGKYIFINSLVNRNKPGSGDVDFRLSRMYDKMRKEGNGLDQEIKYVVKEAYEKYFNGSIDIYEYEENFFYVLYQSWTGRKDDLELIKKIQKAAYRNLSKHPTAIKIYWQVIFPFKGDISNDIDELTKSFMVNTSENAESYITLEQIVNATEKAKLTDMDLELKMKIEWWKRIENDPNELSKYKAWRKITDKNDTLIGYLMKSGFLDEDLLKIILEK